MVCGKMGSGGDKPAPTIPCAVLGLVGAGLSPPFIVLYSSFFTLNGGPFQYIPFDGSIQPLIPNPPPEFGQGFLRVFWSCFFVREYFWLLPGAEFWLKLATPQKYTSFSHTYPAVFFLCEVSDLLQVIPKALAKASLSLPECQLTISMSYVPCSNVLAGIVRDPPLEPVN